MQIINSLVKIYLRAIKRLLLPKDLIRYGVKRNGEKIAVVDGERKINYSVLYQRAGKLANSLLSQGLNKGDKLAVLLYNCQEYFEVRIACYLSGIVLVPLIWDLDLEDMVFILNDCRAKALIYHPQIIKEKAGYLKDKTCLKMFISVISQAQNSEYEQLLLSGSDKEIKQKIKGTDLASINFSSGTTGRPKGVCLTQNSWANSFYHLIASSLRVRKINCVILHLLSLSTAGGTSFLPTFVLGAKNIISKKFSPDTAAAAILEYKVNILFLSPSYLSIILEYCKSKSIKFPLEAVVVGTESFSQIKFKQAVTFFGPVLQQGYGMVEVLPPLTSICVKDCFEDGRLKEDLLLSVGKSLPGVKIKVVDEKNRQCRSDEIGRIIIKSSSCSVGYWNNQELTKQHYRGGWFYSNDLGYFDRAGFLYISGRKEDIIAGKYPASVKDLVFARQIEEVFYQHPSILQAYVWLNNNKIIAKVSLRAGFLDVNEEDLKEFCLGKIKKDLIPYRIIVSSQLPINASGKLDKRKIKQTLGE